MESSAVHLQRSRGFILLLLKVDFVLELGSNFYNGYEFAPQLGEQEVLYFFMFKSIWLCPLLSPVRLLGI